MPRPKSPKSPPVPPAGQQGPAEVVPVATVREMIAAARREGQEETRRHIMRLMREGVEVAHDTLCSFEGRVHSPEHTHASGRLDMAVAIARKVSQFYAERDRHTMHAFHVTFLRTAANPNGKPPACGEKPAQSAPAPGCNGVHKG